MLGEWASEGFEGMKNKLSAATEGNLGRVLDTDPSVVVGGVKRGEEPHVFPSEGLHVICAVLTVVEWTGGGAACWGT